MALLNKIIRPAISPSSPLTHLSNNIQNHHPVRWCSKESGCESLPPCGGKPGDPTMYDCRKYGHTLPENNVCPDFPVLADMPTGVFRCTVGEMLGLGAGKCCYYRNPEFFSYQHMSWYDLHLYMRKYRLPSADLKRKPP